MGLRSNSQKSQLVLEICNISTLSISCSHTLHSPSHFIDWYRILGVEEDADVDFVRKQYRKLALQLHPDKNKHPKAEIAFKLALEAYSCLSDTAKRRSFNLERWKHFCVKCNRIPYIRPNSSKQQEFTTTTHSSSTRVKQSLRDIKERFKEEAEVMENCLKANAALRNQSPLFNPSEKNYQAGFSRCGGRRESPIFNPADYLFEGYPHIRNPIYTEPEKVWYSKRQNSSRCDQRNSGYDSPIFENRSVRRIFETKTAFVSS